MKPHFKVIALLITVSLGFMCLAKLVFSRNQEATRENKTWKVKKVGVRRMGVKTNEPDAESELIIEDQIPPSVPIEVEIKNLETESLLRDIEIKVTNEATKPIYFLELRLVLPDTLSEAGYPISFPLRYGRLDLIRSENRLQPSDVPLLSGKSLILKVAETNLKGFERLRAKGKIIQPEIRKVYLMFGRVNFGDGTGFSSDGLPVPYIRKERSANDCPREENFGTIQASQSSGGSFSDVFGATLAAVNYSPGKSPPQSNLCCPASPPATPCSFVKEDTYFCQCGVGNTTRLLDALISQESVAIYSGMIAPAISRERNIPV